MGIEEQKKLTKNIGWKDVKNYATEKKEQITTKAKNIAGGVNEVIKAITPSKELKDKVKKIAKPFVDESVAIKHLTKVREKIKDKKKRGPRDE